MPEEGPLPVTFDRSVQPATIRLEGEIDIAVAAALKTLLLEALASEKDARISMEAATGMDVTAVQLLWAAERQARASATVLTIDGPIPEALSTAVRDAGFERFPFADAPEAVREVHS
jgi:anti-anti-sigma factor